MLASPVLFARGRIAHHIMDIETVALDSLDPEARELGLRDQRRERCRVSFGGQGFALDIVSLRDQALQRDFRAPDAFVLEFGDAAPDCGLFQQAKRVLTARALLALGESKRIRQGPLIPIDDVFLHEALVANRLECGHVHASAIVA